MGMRRTSALILALLASWEIAASPQQPQPPLPTFRTTIELVEVYVVVTDKNGKPVRGLTRGDFRVTDRRKPQTIATFEEVDRKIPAAAPSPFPTVVRRDVATNSSAPAEQLVVVVVDDYRIWKYRTEVARDIVRKLVDQFSTRAWMSIVFTSGEGGTEITDDPAELYAAIDRVRGRQTVPRPGGWGGKDGSLAEVYYNQPRWSVLQQVAKVIRANDGRRKSLLFVSEGTIVSPREFDQEPRTSLPFRAMEDIRKANAAVYAIDPRGYVSEQELLQECFPSPAMPALSYNNREGKVRFDPCLGIDADQMLSDGYVRVAQEGLVEMSRVSGGFAVTNTDDLDGGIGQIRDAMDHYYLLGFYPAEPKGSGFRPIGVDVNHPDATIHYRTGYYSDSPRRPKRVDPLPALHANVIPANDLPVRVFAVPMPSSNIKKPRIVVALEVTAPAQPLTGPDARLTDDVGFAVIAGDMEVGKVKKGMRRKVAVAARPKAGTQLTEFVHQLHAELAVPPGRYQIRASALSAKAGKGGSAYITVTVPDFTRGALTISGVILGYADGARVVSDSPQPAGLPLLPTLDRDFTRSDVLRVYAEVTAREFREAPHTLVDVMNSDGRIVLSEAARTTIQQQRLVIDHALALEGFRPGAYRLRVSARSGVAVAERQVEFAIR